MAESPADVAPTDPYQACQRMQNPDERCRYVIAVRENDASACRTLTDSGFRRTGCLSAVAEATRNVTLCHEIMDVGNYGVACITKIARDADRPELCLEIAYPEQWKCHAVLEKDLVHCREYEAAGATIPFAGSSANTTASRNITVYSALILLACGRRGG